MNVVRDDTREIENRRLCIDCIGEKFLKEKIEEEGIDDLCHYCGKYGKTISISEMAERVAMAFEHHYRRVSDSEGEAVIRVIADAAQIGEDRAADIRWVLGKLYDKTGVFRESAYYIKQEINVGDLQKRWNRCEDILKTKTRFFDDSVGNTLKDIFGGLIDYRDQDGKSVIVEAGPETEIAFLYRARVFQSKSKLEEAIENPVRDIGPPPANLPPQAGRMNAEGISVFYGASIEQVAIDEVRPFVGSRVVVGEFTLRRGIRLLDVGALQSAHVEVSVFDADRIKELEHVNFWRWLFGHINRPIMPDDEPLEYLVTQVIADYLKSRSDFELDGILYPSVQSGGGGKNAMLFHEASRVAQMDIPVGKKIEVRKSGLTADDWAKKYSVKIVEDSNPTICRQEVRNQDTRDETLELNLQTLKICLIKRVGHEPECHTVKGYPSQKGLSDG